MSNVFLLLLHKCLTEIKVLIMKRLYFVILLILIGVSVCNAQPAGYYDSAEGKVGEELRAALHNIIKGHNSVSYSALWTHFINTDAKPDGTVWDMYSDVPGGTPPYVFNFGNDQCGNYSGEGDCYNREHIWALSWSDDDGVLRTDLFHLVPTDGYVNNRRSNYPFGEVDSPSWTSRNGSKVGDCSVSGYNDKVFEPIDEYKGDIARSLFYVSTRYYGEDAQWSSSGMTNKSVIKAWAVDMLLEWHRDDPVSQKEIQRNEEVYAIQHNRNPFIDNPDFAEMIWSSTWNTENLYNDVTVEVWPNPMNSMLNIKGDNIVKINVFNTLGVMMASFDVKGECYNTINVSSYDNSLLFIQVVGENGNYVTKTVMVAK